MRDACNRGIPALSALACAVLLFGSSASAQQANSQSDWTFQLTPYVWAAGMGGTITTPNGRSASFSQSIGDVLSNLDAGFMMLGEVGYQRWRLLGDFDYVSLTTDASRSLPIIGKASLKTTQYLGTLDGGYRVVDADAVKLDALVGVRVTSVSNTLSFSGIALSASGGDTWADPLVAARAIVPIGYGFLANAYGDVGGGPNGDLTWQLYGGFGYSFNTTVSAYLGYRYLSIRHDVNNLTFDMSQQGPIFGVGVRF